MVFSNVRFYVRNCNATLIPTLYANFYVTLSANFFTSCKTKTAYNISIAVEKSKVVFFFCSLFYKILMREDFDKFGFF